MRWKSKVISNGQIQQGGGSRSWVDWWSLLQRGLQGGCKRQDVEIPDGLVFLTSWLCRLISTNPKTPTSSWLWSPTLKIKISKTNLTKFATGFESATLWIFCKSWMSKLARKERSARPRRSASLVGSSATLSLVGPNTHPGYKSAATCKTPAFRQTLCKLFDELRPFARAPFATRESKTVANRFPLKVWEAMLRTAWPASASNTLMWLRCLHAQHFSVLQRPAARISFTTGSHSLGHQSHPSGQSIAAKLWQNARQCASQGQRCTQLTPLCRHPQCEHADDLPGHFTCRVLESRP